MAIITGLVSAAIYNALPHIHDNATVPERYLKDLDDLRSLLLKHNMPAELGVRLIHKHFDVNEDEVMVFHDLNLSSYGKVQIMRPMKRSEASKTSPIHFLINADGHLQAYEYTTAKVKFSYPNLELFLAEFVDIISARNLQNMFGLKVDLKKKQFLSGMEDEDFIDSQTQVKNTSWTEFEFPEKRSTVLLPDGIPMPTGDYEVSVSTEWYNGPVIEDVRCSHSKRVCKHCTHCRQHQAHTNYHATNDIEIGNGEDLGIYFGGQKVETHDPFHEVVNQLVQVW